MLICVIIQVSFLDDNTIILRQINNKDYFQRDNVLVKLEIVLASIVDICIPVIGKEIGEQRDKQIVDVDDAYVEKLVKIDGEH